MKIEYRAARQSGPSVKMVLTGFVKPETYYMVKKRDDGVVELIEQKLESVTEIPHEEI